MSPPVETQVKLVVQSLTACVILAVCSSGTSPHGVTTLKTNIVFTVASRLQISHRSEAAKPSTAAALF
jgi:hypothetical protein